MSPTTRGESTGETKTRAEVLGEWVESTADDIAGPRARPLDVLLVITVAVSLVAAGASQPVPLAVGMAALVLLAARVLR